MSNRDEFDLLVDLAKLLKRHGPEAFERLADQISRPKFSQSLVSVLSATVKASRAVQTSEGRSGAKSSRRGFRPSLLRLRDAEPERGDVLIQLYDRLMSKTVLPTLRDIKAFVLDNDLPAIKVTSRDKAVIPFVKIFLSMPYEEIAAYLGKLHLIASDQDRSLEGWSKIIFGREGRSTHFSEESQNETPPNIL